MNDAKPCSQRRFATRLHTSMELEARRSERIRALTALPDPGRKLPFVLPVAIAAIVLAVVIPVGIEVLKRPRLTIAPEPWSAAGPVGWVFAVVRVRNGPLSRPWSLLLRRDSATACDVTAEFRRKGQGLAIPAVRCRWSAAPEPIRQVPLPESALRELSTASASASGGPPERWSNIVAAYASTFDPEAVPQSFELDIAPTEDGYEVAVAILLRDRGAFAFSAESYAYGFAKPEWRLERGEYEVTVTARSGQIRRSEVLSLKYLDDDFSRFRLEPLR